MGTAPDECRRRGRPRKNRRHPAGRPLDSPPASFRGIRRPPRLLRDEHSDDDVVAEGDENEHDYEYDEDEQQRVKKKLKLLLKLHRSTPPRREPSPASSVSFSDDDGEYRCSSHSKERRGGGGRDATDREAERKQLDCIYKGSASESGTPLPDLKTLELILDKIQKKDKYSVFAEPVDLDELPDYLEIIEHPMDFTTIRKKLTRNGYANLEEFEVDVFLVCTNAMQYNAPETIYHKQARSMQEVARKSFKSARAEQIFSVQISEIDEAGSKARNARAESRSCDTYFKSQLNDRPDSLEKDPSKSVSKAPQETTDSDTSSIAVNMNGNNAIGLKVTEGIGSEKSIKEGVVVVDASSIVISSMSEKVEKVEELSEKSIEKNIPSKSGLKLVSLDENHRPVDENRRATYNISYQHVVSQPDSVFSTFEAEQKQLVFVGLDTEYSYARSLARFSATLGPIAWRIASEKIEKALPVGVKFGPGWVGEYEPLSMPVLSVMENVQHMQGHDRIDSYRTEAKEDEPNAEIKAKHNAVTTNMPCTTSYSIGGHGRMPNSNVKKSTREGNVEGRLGSIQSSSGHKPAITNDLIHQRRDKSAGVPWKDRTIENSKPSLPKQAPTQNSSSLCNGLADSALRKPQFHLESTNYRILPSVGYKNQTESDSTNGVWISNNQDPIAMNAGFSVKKDAASLYQTPIFMNAGFSDKKDAANSRQAPISANTGFSEKKNAANSCNRDRGLLGSVSRPFESTNNSHANDSAAQAIADPVKSMRMMPGMMLKLQNCPNSTINNCTRQFIPSSPKNIPSVGSGTEGASGGATRGECAAASTPVSAWISIGNYSERKLTEAPGFLKVQPEPHVYKPTCIPSSAPGMYQVTNRRPLLPPSNPHVRSLLPLSNQTVSEKSDLQNNNPAAIPLIFTSELSRPQHLFSWQGSTLHGQQQRKREDMLPPDLNIGFQSPGSPVQRPSGIRIDSQPDLALQL